MPDKATCSMSFGLKQRQISGAKTCEIQCLRLNCGLYPAVRTAMPKKAAQDALSGRIRPRRSGQISVTKKGLDTTRAEIKSDITTLRLEMRAGFKKVDSSFLRIDAQMSELKSMIYRLHVIGEEQNARNIFVLDGYTSLDARVSALEKQKS
jgi:hypothetical protein